MGRISTAICFILALLTVLSIGAPLLLAWACEFSSGCIALGFWKFMIGPDGIRTQSLMLLLVAILIPVAYVLTFVRCQKSGDILNQSGSVSSGH